MKPRLNQIVYILGDILSVASAVLLTVGLKTDWAAFHSYTDKSMALSILFSSIFIVAAGFLLGSYNSLWAYIGFSDIFKQILIVTLNAAAALILRIFFVTVFSYSDIILFWGILLVFTCGIRSVPRCRRWYFAMRESKNGHTRRAIIIGAGAAGSMIIKRLCTNTSDGIYPVAVLDDDPSKQGKRLSGIPVCGRIIDVKQVADKIAADAIIIAIPSASHEALDAIYSHCLETSLPIKIFQSVVDCKSFIHGDRNALIDVPIEDLLSREAVTPDLPLIRSFIRNKTVLVTGGAGSIGSELCRQILQYGSGKLVVLDINENGLFALGEELKKRFTPERYALYIGSIQDEYRLDQVFITEKPDIIFHAAAHKHVPLMEDNPAEAIKNNIFGTRNVVRACVRHQASRFVLISTDKAVHPTSVMGATKRIAELIVQSMNGKECEMSAVRFGNVLGSNGSVVPTFKRQIATGGPVTVTHKDIKRYFMTIPEAVSLVLSAGSHSNGGEVFVLDMGKPIRIYDLACRLIRLAGLEPGKDIEIKITGLRPGEKLFEELSLDSETIQKTESDKIFIFCDKAPLPLDLVRCLDRLQNMVVQGSSNEAIHDMIFEIIADSQTNQNKPLAVGQNNE